MAISTDQARTFASMAIVCLAVATFGTVPHAQSTASFQVASIKRADAGREGPPAVALHTGGRLTAPNVTLKELVRVAFAVEPDQVLGGPGWVDDDRFEIAANARLTASVDDARAMLRTLLADRFHLAVHREMRDLGVYVIDSTETRGPGLRPAADACTDPPKAPSGVPRPPPPPPPPAGQAPMTILNLPRGTACGAMLLNGWLSARRVSIGWFAEELARVVHRQVLDHTGLAGNFDIDLAYTPDTGPLLLNGQSISGDAPALSTAMREQLGLKLTSTKQSLPVVVIDRAEPPTAN
jgi:uncharacterized protein (TIGR03435 family)